MTAGALGAAAADLLLMAQVEMVVEVVDLGEVEEEEDLAEEVVGAMTRWAAGASIRLMCLRVSSVRLLHSTCMWGATC